MRGTSSVNQLLRRVSAVSVVVATSLAITGPSSVSADTGCATAAAPSLVSSVYEVDTPAKLQWVKDSGSMSASYKLTSNINLSGCTWSNGIGSFGTPFSGTFDGNGMTVSNLTISAGNVQGLGFIDYLSGSVSNLTLTSPSVTGTGNENGALVGELKATGTVTNIQVTATAVSGNQIVGGVIGYALAGSTVTTVEVSGTAHSSGGVGGGVIGSTSGSATGLVSSVAVTGTYTLGGLAGDMGNAASLTNSSATGNVTASSNTAGGAVGTAAGSRPNCPTITNVTTSGRVESPLHSGGILAWGNCYFISRSSSSSVVISTGQHAGGIVGYDNNPGEVSKSFFTGQVSATESVGGIAGLSRSVITDTYSKGTVTASSGTNGGRAGGLVGWLQSAAAPQPAASITNSYASGLITPPVSASHRTGGLVGYLASGTITASVWDVTTTGLATSHGTGAVGYSTQQLRDHVLYNADNLNWSITDGRSTGNGYSTGTTWSICSGAHSGYPYLTLQGLTGTCLPTMAYNGNGHTGGTQPSDPTTPYTSGATVTVLGNTGSLTKTSRIFSGWNTKADGTGLAYVSGDTFSITAPVMLFAVWTTTPAVVYGANGGSGTAAVTTGASGSTVTLGTGSGLTKSGFTLSRWDTASAGNGISYTLGQSITMPAGGLVLYAVWTPAAPTTTTTAAPATTSTTTTVAASAPTTVASGGASTPTVTTSTTTPSTSAGQSSTSPGVVTPTTAAQTGASAGSGSSSAAASTTTTVANTTSTTAAPPSDAPDVDGVSVGEVGATVAGRPATAKVDTVDGSLIVEVGGGVIKYSVKGEDGAARAIAQGEQIFLRAGDTVRVDFAGFAAQAESSAWLSPGKMLLGTTRLENGAGFVEGVVDDSAPEGDRRIAVATESADGDPVVVAYGVSIAEGESSGTSWSVLLLVIVGLAVVGGLLIPAARRRRDEENA